MSDCSVQDEDQYSCSVCLDLMRDPVTIPCGHSYCMDCIQDYWKKNQLSRIQCPQCRHEYSTRPALNKNTLLAELLDKLSVSVLQGSSPAPAPGEVVCDLCSERKLQAVRSCLQCQVSYCEMHLQPHYNVPALKKHKLVNARRLLTCSRHGKLLEVFCRTDNVCICTSCLMDRHKGHDTLSSTEAREEKQVTLRLNKLQCLEKRKEKERKLDELRKDGEDHTKATQQLVENTEGVFNSLISSIEKSCSEMIDKIRTEEKIHRDQSADLQEKLEDEIAALMQQEDVMDKLLETEDDINFLQNVVSSPSSSPAETPLSHTPHPLDSFSDVNQMISELKVKLKDFCEQELDTLFTHCSAPIRTGDRVRVKLTVKTPKFNWGSITHRSVGVVTVLSEETLTVDFQEHKNWKGLQSEMERVTDESEIPAQFQRRIKVGDKVRVKSSVISPTRGWGAVKHGSVGVVTSLNKERLSVNFPEHSGWAGVVSEMEIVC